MKKNVLTLALSVLILIILGQGAWATGTPEKNKVVELRFSWWGGQARNDIYNEITDRFEADNPGIKISREPISWNDYWTKIPTQIAGGGAPDIMQMHARYVKLFSDRNALMDLTSLIDSGVIDLSDFSPAAIETGVVDGKPIMVSIGLTTTGLAVNSRLVKQVGVTVPESMDWNEYESLLLDIAKKSDGAFYATGDDSLASTTSVPITMFMRTRGKDLYTVDGKIGFDKEDLAAWWSMWDRLRKGGAVPTAQISVEDATKTFEQGMFVAGKQVFAFIPVNRLKIFQELMPEDPLFLVRTPHLNGQGGEYLEGAHIAINAKTEHPQEAARFINYFVNSKRSLELYKAENGFPASQKMNEYVYTLLGPSEQQSSKFMEKVANDASIGVYILPPDKNADVLRILDMESQAVAFGSKSIPKAVDDFFKTVENL